MDDHPRRSREIEQTLQAAGVPVHGVQNNAACYADPQLQHRNHYLAVPTRCTARASSKARAWCCRAPRRWSAGQPSMGEHNDLVLGQLLGYDEDKITDLVIAGALG